MMFRRRDHGLWFGDEGEVQDWPSSCDGRDFALILLLSGEYEWVSLLGVAERWKGVAESETAMPLAVVDGVNKAGGDGKGVDPR